MLPDEIFEHKQAGYLSLLRALTEGEVITSKDSIERWELYALPQAVAYVKWKFGINIENIGERVQTPSGTYVKYGKYRIPPVELERIRKELHTILCTLEDE